MTLIGKKVKLSRKWADNRGIPFDPANPDATYTIWAVESSPGDYKLLVSSDDTGELITAPADAFKLAGVV